MRFFRCTAFLVLVCAVCFCSALAADLSDGSLSSDPLTDSDYVAVETLEDDRQIVLNVMVTPPSVDVVAEAPVVNVEAPVFTSDDSVAFDSFPVYSLLSLDDFVTLLDVDSSGNTLRAVLVNLFGEYMPRTQTVTQYLEDGSSVEYQEYVSGVAGMDWPWIAGVVLFALMLYCLFRLLGGVLTHG